jgi:hypothetical protein
MGVSSVGQVKVARIASKRREMASERRAKPWKFGVFKKMPPFLGGGE